MHLIVSGVIDNLCDLSRACTQSAHNLHSDCIFMRPVARAKARVMSLCLLTPLPAVYTLSIYLGCSKLYLSVYSSTHAVKYSDV